MKRECILGNECKIRDFGFASWLILSKKQTYTLSDNILTFSISESNLKKFKSEYKKTELFKFEELKRSIIKKVRAGK